MGRPKRLYPLGKYCLRTPKVIDKEKAYPIELEYTWNRQVIRKTTNVFVKVADWNPNGNQGRGALHGCPDTRRFCPTGRSRPRQCPNDYE